MTDEQNAVELVRRGYEEGTRCLNFRVNFYTWSDSGIDNALEAIRLIGGYNEFNGEVVAEALRPVLKDCMSIAVGREGSPVLYFRTNDSDTKTRLRKVLRKLRADEIDTEGRELRAWWD